MTATKLDVGAGLVREDGWTSVDIDPMTRPDLLYPLHELPYYDSTVDELRCIHALEHVTEAQAKDAVNEWARVLVPGGRLAIETPDLAEICSMFESSLAGDRDFLMHALYGGQSTAFQFHRWGYTAASLRELVESAGLTVTSVQVIGRGSPTVALRLEATK